MTTETVTGKVVRFEAGRGYGFIAPDHGGDDVFVHASELEGADVPISCGSRVTFKVVESVKGAKAYDVRVVRDDGAAPAPTPTAAVPAAVPANRPSSDAPGDDMCEVLSAQDFRQEVTELILAACPSITGAQVVQIRDGLLDFAGGHGWLE